MKFSVVTIVYNEEKRLAASLNQFGTYTDDIVVIDTESMDKTSEIAKTFTKKVLTVPFVGYPDCYKESAMLRSKYDWCLFSYPDEIWPTKLLDFLTKIDENIEEKCVAFKRQELMDGVVKSVISGWHYRVFKKGYFYLCDLADKEIDCGYKTLEVDMEIIHSKTSEEFAIDRDLRKKSYNCLLTKYRFTLLEPYRTMCDSYRGDYDK